MRLIFIIDTKYKRSDNTRIWEEQQKKPFKGLIIKAINLAKTANKSTFEYQVSAFEKDLETTNSFYILDVILNSTFLHESSELDATFSSIYYEKV